jgi:hypothetical protein
VSADVATCASARVPLTAAYKMSAAAKPAGGPPAVPAESKKGEVNELRQVGTLAEGAADWP